MFSNSTLPILRDPDARERRLSLVFPAHYEGLFKAVWWQIFLCVFAERPLT
jgi:hypothetical protein